MSEGPTNRNPLMSVPATCRGRDQPQVDEQDGPDREHAWQDPCDPAGREITFSIFFFPQAGQATSLNSSWTGRIISNSLPQRVHRYSYIGISFSPSYDTAVSSPIVSNISPAGYHPHVFNMSALSDHPRATRRCARPSPRRRMRLSPASETC